MSRPIKFRAWDKDIKRMRAVRALTDRKGVGWHVYVQDSAEVGCTLLPGEFELMQFTGLHDKAGREIYEGDIIKSTPPPRLGVPQKSLVGPVKYFVEAATFGLAIGVFARGLWVDGIKNIEVIGNVHENPELLTVVLG